MQKVLAVLEVLLVRGVILAADVLLVPTAVTGWQIVNLPHVYTSHLLFIVVPVLWLWIARRDFSVYGLRLDHLKADLHTAISAYLPVALSGSVLGFVAFTRGDGALIMSIVQVGVLFWVAHTLTRKPDPKSGVVTVVLSIVLFGIYGMVQSALPEISTAVLRFVYYLFFVGFGEEILNRGYILTRLNQAFGCPREFYGVAWGWGAVISAALFGLSHVLNGWNILTGEFNPMWWWGLWTFFGAFVFTFIREKSGSIVPAAIVHGLPQALLALFISTI